MHSSIPVWRSIRVVGLVCLTASLIGSPAVFVNECRAEPPTLPADPVHGTLVDSAARVVRDDCPRLGQVTSAASAASVGCRGAGTSTKRISPVSSEDETHRVRLKPDGSVCIECLPKPVSPPPQHRPEEKSLQQVGYDRVPILGPTTAGGPAVALDPPSDDEIMRAWELTRYAGEDAPSLSVGRHTIFRIVKEKIADYVDPPRFYPLIGPAQLHHAHYRCTIHRSADDTEVIGVIHVDHNHFHMIGDVEPYAPPNLQPIAPAEADR